MIQDTTFSIVIIVLPIYSTNGTKRYNQMSPSPRTITDFKKEGLPQCDPLTETPARYVGFNRENEFDILKRNFRLLQECSWFHSDFSATEAKHTLAKTTTGTFLLRNSSDPKYLYSLSVKTERGPTSVRIKYSHGLFQVDCEENIRDKLPRFENVVALVDFHLIFSKTDAHKTCRWVDGRGNRQLCVKLDKPMLKKTSSLKHICRLTINNNISDIHLPETSTNKLPLPQILKNYLRDYTYKI